MVVCSVPTCGSDSWKSDGTVTFYNFPSNPDLKAKWIKQINTAIKTKPMWFPRGKPIICSKHFLHTDFKGDTDTLKPRSIPTVFGHKYIGRNPESNETNTVLETKSPLIVKVLRPNINVTENDSDLLISDVRSQAVGQDSIEKESLSQVSTYESSFQVSSKDTSVRNDHQPTIKNSTYINDKHFQSPSYENTNLKNKCQPINNVSSTIPKKPNASVVLQHKNNSNSVTATNASKKFPSKQPAVLPRKNNKKENNSDLIEIGPNTFLKINPDVIKVNKKQTPSGNTVLQFLMDQKLAKNYTSDLLPKLIQGVPPSSVKENSFNNPEEGESSDNNKNKNADPNNKQKETVQHVLGHVVDNHVCQESCIDLTLDDDEVELMDISQNDESHTNISHSETSTENQNKTDNTSNAPNKNDSSNTDKSFIDNAPVLLTTNMPLSHCFIDRPKYILQLKQKNRQIASLKFKISSLNKKIEELEDRCIVQERQLSYSFIKRLKTIRKNAAKGDPCATYILEQIRSYAYTNNSKMRWSDSTLTQCAIWCRKAPYAYEYFKKAEFFKLPCLGTVKRFMKKHPEIKFQKKISKSVQPGEDDDESSSDFDFDESDGQNDNDACENENNESVTCETMLSEIVGSSEIQDANIKHESDKKENNEIEKATESITNHSSELNIQDITNETNGKTAETLKSMESNGIPVTIDTSNLELQEIILPSGEVVQCYSSNIVNGAENGQYFIIPNVTDPNNVTNHEFSVVQADSMPVILQNIENSQLHVQQQDQLIVIANSSNQVECSETEVTSA